MTLQIHRARVKKLWIPYGGLGLRIPPRLVQLLRLLRCAATGHQWSQWRVETEDWFEYVDGPELWAGRRCENDCGTIEHVGEAR